MHTWLYCSQIIKENALHTLKNIKALTDGDADSSSPVIKLPGWCLLL